MCSIDIDLKLRLYCPVFQREEQHEPVQRLNVCILCILLKKLGTDKGETKNRSQDEKF